MYGDEELPISAMASDENTFTRSGMRLTLLWRKGFTLVRQLLVLYRCVAVLGDLIPVRGRHYWEVEVDDDTEFRIGVAYEDTERNSYLGANSTSWCMRHIVTPSRWHDRPPSCSIKCDVYNDICYNQLGLV